MDIDPYANDPGRWGASLVTLAEIIVPCLDAAGARSVVEVGAYAGDLTRLLVDWAAVSGARVTAIDPAPRDPLVALERERPELDLIRATSHEALAGIAPPDAAIIDGDHNWFTVSRGAAAHRRGRRRRRAAAAALPRRRVAARAPRRLLRPAPRSRGASPADRGGHGAVPRRVRRAARRPALSLGGAARGRPAQRRAHRGRGLRRRARRAAARRGARVLRSRRGLAPRRALGRSGGRASSRRGTATCWSRASRPIACSTSPPRTCRWSRRRARSERIARQEAVLRRLLESSAFAVAERLSRLRRRAGHRDGSLRALQGRHPPRAGRLTSRRAPPAGSRSRPWSRRRPCSCCARRAARRCGSTSGNGRSTGAAATSTPTCGRTTSTSRSFPSPSTRRCSPRSGSSTRSRTGRSWSSPTPPASRSCSSTHARASARPRRWRPRCSCSCSAPAWQNILWPFQVGWLLSLAAGLGALLALDRGDRRGEAAACALVALSLASSGIGVAIAAGVLVDVLWRRPRAAWIVRRSRGRLRRLVARLAGHLGASDATSPARRASPPTASRRR